MMTQRMQQEINRKIGIERIKYYAAESAENKKASWKAIHEMRRLRNKRDAA